MCLKQCKYVRYIVRKRLTTTYSFSFHDLITDNNYIVSILVCTKMNVHIDVYKRLYSQLWFSFIGWTLMVMLLIKYPAIFNQRKEAKGFLTCNWPYEKHIFEREKRRKKNTFMRDQNVYVKISGSFVTIPFYLLTYKVYNLHECN